MYVFLYLYHTSRILVRKQKKECWLCFVESTSSICYKRKLDQTDIFVCLLKEDRLYKSIFTFAAHLKTAPPLQSVY